MISSMDATLGGKQGATCTAECALSYLGLLRETGVEILNGSRGRRRDGPPAGYTLSQAWISWDIIQAQPRVSVRVTVTMTEPSETRRAPARGPTSSSDSE
jgi:hypothetical protein